jgi:hypothetical protein
MIDKQYPTDLVSYLLKCHMRENEQGSSTPPIIRTVRNDDAMTAFNAEENNMQAEDTLTLKRLQENFLKIHIETKDRPPIAQEVSRWLPTAAARV